MRITQPPNTSRGTAAIYARQSRTDDSKKDKQKKEQHIETTLATQSAACRKHALALGYAVLPESVFTERYTGAEMWDRPVLSEVRRRIKAREYSALFVYSTDRLARDPIHLALILEECQRANCDLVFVTEPLENSPEGELILYIKGYASKIERLRIRDRMARGRNAIIAAGKLNCAGNPLYGYKFDNANRVRVVDPVSSKIVQDIFRWVADGLSAQGAVRKLNAMHVPCPAAYTGRVFKRGNPAWSVCTMLRILKDETYLGVTQVNKSKATDERDKKTGRNKMRSVGKDEWKTLPEGVTPAIITRDVFDVVQKRLIANMRNAVQTRNGERQKLLRGVLFCGDCGCLMYPMSGGSDGSKIEVYRCSAVRRRADYAQRHAMTFPIATKDCKASALRSAEIEDAVWSKLVGFLLNPKIVEREVERVLSSVPDNTLTVDLAGAEKQLVRSRRLREKALEQYELCVQDGDDEMAARWDARSKEANSDVRALAAVIKDLNARLAAYNNSGKTARAFAVQCKKIMGTGEFTFNEKRAALEALNVKVFAVGRTVRIQLNAALVGEQIADQVKVEVCV